MKRTGRSLSGHNQDIKRLLDIGALKMEISNDDKRKRIYAISENLKYEFINK